MDKRYSSEIIRVALSPFLQSRTLNYAPMSAFSYRLSD